jgi:C-7 ketoreductase
VVVTGAGTGIGRATARAFADCGDGVLAVGRTGTTLRETARGRTGIQVLTADITDLDAPAAVVDTAIREFGRIDVLVNNAALGCFDPIGKLADDTVRAQVATNLVAPVLLTQQALDALAASRGVVVNVSSAGAIGLRAMPNSSVYAATKAGLDSLTRTWAVELAPRGIRVVSIAPGLIDTGMGVRAGLPQEAYDGFLAAMSPQVPSGRIGTPEEIAAWIVRLSGSDSAYVNGALLAVDGGLSLT